MLSLTSTDPERQSIIATLDPSDLEEHLGFLDNLRESGAINMFGARPYLMETYDLDKRTASAVLAFWMETFAKRHPQGGAS